MDNSCDIRLGALGTANMYNCEPNSKRFSMRRPVSTFGAVNISGSRLAVRAAPPIACGTRFGSTSLAEKALEFAWFSLVVSR